MNRRLRKLEAEVVERYMSPSVREAIEDRRMRERLAMIPQAELASLIRKEIAFLFSGTAAGIDPLIETFGEMTQRERGIVWETGGRQLTLEELKTMRELLVKQRADAGETIES